MEVSAISTSAYFQANGFDAGSLAGRGTTPGARPGGITAVSASRGQAGGALAEQLTPDEKREVDRLKKIDAEVRSHEQAHLTAGGPHIRSSASFQYQRGADGRNYAVGGDVLIDVSPVRGNPAATVTKMQTVKRAALAPMNPSSQDRSVAARATQLESAARAEMNRETAQGDNPAGTGGIATPYQQYARVQAGAFREGRLDVSA